MRSTARTVLLAMAEDAERAERIKAVKKERPLLKWRHVSEAADVKERTVLGWAKTGQLSYEHAKVLAEVAEVDLDWLWRGPAQQSPDLMGALSQNGRQDQLDRIETKLDGLRDSVQELLRRALEQELEDAPPEAPPADGTATGTAG